MRTSWEVSAAMADEQYGQYASPEQQGFYESGFTLEDQHDPGQQQQQWSQGPSSYYSAPPPHQQHVYSAEGYGQQSKRLLASKLHVCILVSQCIANCTKT